MTNYVAGTRLTADLLNDNSLSDSTDTGLVAATNFTVVSFTGRRTNGITSIEVFVQRTTGSVSEAGSNLGDIVNTDLCTLPEGWRPPETITSMWGNGFNDGGCVISSTGSIQMWSTSGTSCIPNLSNVRVSANWIAES